MAFDWQSLTSKVRVLDGAWGTELQKRGLAAGVAPELWNVDSPGHVEAVARSYVQAGSDVILTNTFGANRFVLDSHGAADRVAQLAEAGARISKKAAGQEVKVFASIGPTGRIVMMDEVPRDRISAAFAESAEALAWGGADAIVLETFNELDELALALEAVRKATDVPVVACMTFASGPDGTMTMMGNKPADLARLARRAGAAAVGANCGVGPDNYVKVTALLREATDLPIWIKPNAGLPQIVKGQTVFPMGPQEYASFVPKLIRAGATFVGGCCGTTPEHIRAVRAEVDAHAQR
ncbi:MAG TPA: homocysteine S-methyltransferase family protein [Phycisphaerae bacterium]|nr:homocysteine S-methyltransferase family protein [Phycisphaerae bacterium]